MAHQQMSSRSNLYFDINVKTSPSESKRIWVMENSQSKRTFYKNIKSPVEFTGLSLTNGGVSFYNSNIGSKT